MGTDQVPFLDLQGHYQAHQSELRQAVDETLDSASFVLGENVRRFEDSFASFCGVAHAVGCGNGTDAIELLLEAEGIGPGDEVLTVSHTFTASVSPIVRAGATPVLIDVHPETLLLDDSLIEAALSDKTKAILVVHLYGSIASTARIHEIASANGLHVYEDAAQAHGARLQGRRAGSLARAATFSFYPGKNLGAFGDGGAVVTNDEGLAERILLLRDHGKSDKFTHEAVGRNSRLDGLQAAVLDAKLRFLDEDNALRRSAYDYYANAIQDKDLPVDVVAVPDEVEAAHHLLVVQVPQRDAVMKALQDKGIGVGIHYPIPVHQQPGFSSRVRVASTLKVTEEACEHILSLPMFPGITSAQQDRVVAALAEALEEVGVRDTALATGRSSNG